MKGAADRPIPLQAGSRVLVTGAGGFVGTHLCRFLKSIGVTVVAATRHPKSPEHVELDVASLDSVHRVFEAGPFETVIHLAAHIPKIASNTTAEECARINGLGAHNVASTAAATGTRRMINASSASVYSRRGTSAHRTEAEAQPGDVYGASKLFGEQLFALAAEGSDSSVASLRFSSIYGEGQSVSSVLPIFVERALRGLDLEVWGEGRRTQDFLHVSDAVWALTAAAGSASSGTFNIGSGVETSMLRLANEVAQVCDVPLSRIVRRQVDREDTSRFALDVSRATNELGFAATISLQAGLRRYVDHLSALR